MRLGIVGRGRWGHVYARTCDALGIPWSWGVCGDGVIVATPSCTHYYWARELIPHIPVLLEKPVALETEQARELVSLGGIVFTGHARLASPSWRRFKASLSNPEKVVAVMGREVPDPWMECGTHLVAMCLDAGVEPQRAVISTPSAYIPLSFTVDGATWVDDHSERPLMNLVSDFAAAIERGEPDNSGLELGAKVVEFLNEFRGLHISQSLSR